MILTIQTLGLVGHWSEKNVHGARNEYGAPPWLFSTFPGLSPLVCNNRQFLILVIYSRFYSSLSEYIGFVEAIWKFWVAWWEGICLFFTVKVQGCREGRYQSVCCSNMKKSGWWKVVASWHLVQDVLKPKGTCLTRSNALNDRRGRVKSGSRNTTGLGHISLVTYWTPVEGELENVLISTPCKSRRMPRSMLAASWQRMTAL